MRLCVVLQCMAPCSRSVRCKTATTVKVQHCAVRSPRTHYAHGPHAHARTPVLTSHQRRFTRVRSSPARRVVLSALAVIAHVSAWQRHAHAAHGAGGRGGQAPLDFVLWPANVSAFFTTPGNPTTLTWTAGAESVERSRRSFSARNVELRYTITG